LTDTPAERESEGPWVKLRRRKVVQWGVAYAAGAWGFLQGLAYVSTLLDWPSQIQKLVGLALLVGLPIALELEPANPDILGVAAVLARRLGRLDQAIAIAEYQMARDPANTLGRDNLGYMYRYAGRLDEAISEFRTGLSLSPGYIAGHEGIGEVLLQKGDAEAALEEMQQETVHAMRLVGLSMAYHALGRQAESDAALTELIAGYEKTYTFNIAYVLAFRGEADRAFEWLRKSVQNHDLYLSAIVRHPMFENIHEDPRWLPFLRELGLAPEQLTAIKFDVKVPK
jgi:tetratricopeptide (TPR) repeat protein